MLVLKLYVTNRQRWQIFILHINLALMRPTHESKTIQDKFNGRKGVGDEVLELPMGIMQDNTQVGWKREV